MMSKFCTSCGTVLNEGAKFCTKCGAKAAAAPVESVVQTEQTEPKQAEPKRKAALSKVGEQVAAHTKTKAAAYAQDVLSDRVPAAGSAGEFALPIGSAPFSGLPAAEGLPAIIKSGFAGLAGGMKRTLKDKNRLAIVIALAVIWLLVNSLSAFGISPLPVKVLSWLTAARGSLLGGSIGKGLVAALLARIMTDKGLLQGIKGGLGQLTSVFKDGKSTNAPLLFGAGTALIACNLMVSSSLQNTMVCIAGFALSAKALTQNGFLRRLASALLPKASGTAVTALMGGWTLGFALFAAISFLPGGKNGILAGILLLIIGGIMMAVNKGKKEVAAK
jgi:hypothetical protein